MTDPGELFKQYLAEHRYSDRTIRTYCFIVDKFKGIGYECCNFNDVTRAISSKQYSLRYRQVILSALKGYFYCLIEKGLRVSHPCDALYIRGNYSKEHIESDFLSHYELQLLKSRVQRYGNLEVRDQLLLSILTTQGLTATELVKLRLGDIDKEHGMICVRQSRKYLKRKLPLLSNQKLLLTKYLNGARSGLVRYNSDTLFLGKNGTSLTADSVHYLISTLKQLIPDKRLTPMLIRQSVISWWINGLKIPLEQVQLLCGHRWISTTQKYQFHSLPDDVKMVNKWL